MRRGLDYDSRNQVRCRYALVPCNFVRDLLFWSHSLTDDCIHSSIWQTFTSSIIWKTTYVSKYNFVFHMIARQYTDMKNESHLRWTQEHCRFACFISLPLMAWWLRGLGYQKASEHSVDRTIGINPAFISWITVIVFSFFVITAYLEINIRFFPGQPYNAHVPWESNSPRRSPRGPICHGYCHLWSDCLLFNHLPDIGPRCYHGI